MLTGCRIEAFDFLIPMVDFAPPPSNVLSQGTPMGAGLLCRVLESPTLQKTILAPCIIQAVHEEVICFRLMI